ncbi:hypothetical protein Kpol_401p8 [Vanderwaltozyma polyspora DSM 70294]|uniref:Uncharacterized protein n=1 Tax=Vanderwaltozyma polyspora (strain ATCC 22028 / DSM 70294 / BCRC 21397 / CBS 2163 / NBRC 10782 / NRRL Y-8283 / UCD 57-17) TaxID=436907 RepID=A7TRA7_VANPO|nr:uncharacterized protein Kpol_401p8 [Vanderwaltozyma polyspora DSM 70294]EDO15203.1 hypothetical protein Kpol_401p8 [Vanderwaltozyma polyspora DSM 70294]
MSSELQEQQQVDDNAPQEEFIAVNEVDQEVIADDNAPVEEDEMDEDLENDENEDSDTEKIEIDMSNNSVAYFDKHTDSVFSVFQHPSVPLICSGGGDNVAHLWTSHSSPPKFAGTISDHTESVITGGFTSEGKFLVTADMTGKVLVSKSSNGGAQWKVFSQLSEVEEVVWLKCHPTVAGVFAFGATDGSVWCYQINESSGSLDLLMSSFAHQEDCTMGEFINTDKGENTVELVTCSLDSTIIVWNCYTAQALHKITKDEIKGQEAPWVSVAAAPPSGNAAIVACGSNNGILAIINCTNGSVLNLSQVVELKPEQDELDASVESISWSTKFPLMAVGLVCGEILLYDINSWRVRRRFVLTESVTRLQFDNDDLFISCMDGKVYQFDARTGQEKFVCTGHNMGVLDFVLAQPKDNNGLRRVITAGDEGVSLVFEVPN